MKRINILYNILGIMLALSILIVSIGQEFFKEEFIHYFFWLCLGLFIGFSLGKYEYRKVIKRIRENKH